MADENQSGAIEQPVINPDNLTQYMDPEEVKKIGRLVRDEFDRDILSRTDYDARRAKWLKLFAGVRDPKSFPWKDCANTHVPIIAYAALQFQARSSEALMPPKEVAKCYATDGTAVDSADRASKYMNWQMYYQMDEWVDDMDALLMILPVMGSAYKKTYYDRTTQRPSSRLLSVDEFVTPYRCRRVEEAPRKTHVLWKTKNDLMLGQRDGLYVNVDALPDKPSSPTLEMPQYREESDKIQGESMPADFDKFKILEQHRLLDLNFDLASNSFLPSDGIQKDYIVTVDYDTQTVLRITPNLYFNEIEQKYEPFEYFTAYSFIPNPDSHYSFGFGHLLDHLNETADTIINQLIDAGTLANLQGGFINKRSGIRRGDLDVAPGQFKEVEAGSDDLRKAIFPFQFKEPSNVLFTLLGLLQNYAKEITSTADWMSGQMPPSDTAATTIIAVIEQGLKVFSSIQKRCHRSLGRELRKIFKLNAVHLDERVYFVVQDSTSREFKTLKSGKADFANMVDVIPVSDPNITSRAEQLIKAQQVLTEAKSNPLMAQNPMSLYFATKAYLEAFDARNIDQILPMPEPQEPPDLTPEEEHAEFLRDVSVKPLPQQDHVHHITNHKAFQASVWFNQLTPQGKKVFEAHMRDTLAFLYLAQEQALKEQVQLIGKRQQLEGVLNAGRSVRPGGMEGVEPPPDNQGVPGQAQGAA